MNNIGPHEMEILKLHSHQTELEGMEAMETPGMGEGAQGGEFGNITDEFMELAVENVVREAGDESTIPDHLSSSIGSPGKRTIFSQ